MIAGVGIDIVETARFRRLIERFGTAFLGRHFTGEEIRQCEGSPVAYRCFAQLFAAKEAVLKALRLEWEGGIFWKEIAVLDQGCRGIRVTLSGQARQAADTLKVSKVELSMSGAREYAVAVAVATTGGTGMQEP